VQDKQIKHGNMKKLLELFIKDRGLPIIANILFCIVIFLSLFFNDLIISKREVIGLLTMIVSLNTWAFVRFVLKERNEKKPNE
jgi:hypothetical protein